MRMPSILSLCKQPRKAVEHLARALSRRLDPPDPSDADRLNQLLNTIPQRRPDLDAWHAETTRLIARLLSHRITRDDWAAILAGLAAYQRTGATPEEAHQALVRGFCDTSGVLQELLHRVLFARHPGEALPPRSEFFGAIDSTQMRDIVQRLTMSGYCVMPFRLNTSVLSEINEAVRALDYDLRDRADDNVPTTVAGLDVKNPPRCVAAYARRGEIAKVPVLTEIMRDPLIVAIASAYLGTEISPIDATLWHSFASASGVAASDSAQMYHFDLDTLRWVKVFYYLSDVGPDNGPHTYVEGSHAVGAKHPRLLARGYNRISDTEMAHLQKQAQLSITGTAGTVIFADTRCFHKGAVLRAGHRSIFQPLYAPSRIGFFFGET